MTSVHSSSDTACRWLTDLHFQLTRMVSRFSAVRLKPITRTQWPTARAPGSASYCVSEDLPSRRCGLGNSRCALATSFSMASNGTG